VRSAAFFDLDKTILAKSSVLALAGPLFEAQLLTRREVTRSAYAQLNFVAGRADHSMMEKMRAYLSAVVAGWDTATLRRVIELNLEQVVIPLVYAEATALIADHHSAGREVVMVTSTGADLADPIGGLLGVDHVLATKMIERDGRYTGEIADYMYGDRKASAIIELAAAKDLDLATCYAYSDSLTDLPLLEAVGHPYAVNPDRDLRRIASERGWTVLDFRDAPVLSPHPPRRQLIMVVAASVVAGGLGALTLITLRRSARRPTG